MRKAYYLPAVKKKILYVAHLYGQETADGHVSHGSGVFRQICFAKSSSSKVLVYCLIRVFSFTIFAARTANKYYIYCYNVVLQTIT